MKKITIFLILLLSTLCVNAQGLEFTEDEKAENEIQIHQMVNYLQETLNFIGDPRVSAQEKDIIFKESYNKIFRDENVQVEDDLDENRGTSINKDVQAYLKDIDFFFDNVKFQFEIQNITPQLNEMGEPFFKVEMARKIAGRNIIGDTINNTIKRFLEINIDQYKKELKIVSFYTTKPNAKDELFTWWNSMSKPWKEYLGKDFYVNDTISMSQINMILGDAFTILAKRPVLLQDTFMIVDKDTMTMDRIDELYGHRPDTIVYIDEVVSRWVNDTIYTSLTPVYEILAQIAKTTEVNVSGHKDIENLDPLAELSELRSLDCSGTNVRNINPIRNLNKIRELNISDTYITDISNLKYANVVQDFKADNVRINDISVVGYFKDLTSLSISNTDVYDISALAKCSNLSTLNLSGTKMSDITPLKDILKLYDVNVSNTLLSDVTSLQGLVNLHFLNIENTQVSDLSSLSNLDRLNEINFSNTPVTDINVLGNMPHLTKIYCDNSLVSKEMADTYKMNNPNVLVINESEALLSWWNELPSFWKTILKDHANTSINPTKEELHAIINIRNLRVEHYMQDVAPISRLTNLEYLDLSNSKIDDISPLYGLHNLKSLNISGTIVSDLTPLASNKNLRELNIENTKVESLNPLHEINALTKIYADGSNVSTDDVIELRKIQRQAIVIYQTDDLRLWWGNLDDTWREIFNNHFLCNSNPTAEQLQSIINLEEIVIDADNVVYTLEPLTQIVFLKKLVVNNNQIQDLSPLSDKQYLEILSVSGNPVDNIMPLSNLSMLKNLNIENTPVADLHPIAGLKNIKVLNIAGTSVSNLKPLAGFESLEDLSIVNTGVKSVVTLENLSSLKHLKAYKTKIKNKHIELLRMKNPDLNIMYY